MEWIVNSISMFTNNFVRFFSMCKTFFQSVIDFFNNVLSIISTLRFWLKTLLSWIWSLIVEIFDWTLFWYLLNTFNHLSSYVWLWTALFISSLFFIIIIRIVVAFVFKILRFNVDYNSLQKKL